MLFVFIICASFYLFSILSRESYSFKADCCPLDICDLRVSNASFIITENLPIFCMPLSNSNDPLDTFEAYYCFSTIEFLNGYLGFTDDLYIGDERFITSSWTSLQKEYEKLQIFQEFFSKNGNDL
jgi:hypothetical protein